MTADRGGISRRLIIGIAVIVVVATAAVIGRIDLSARNTPANAAGIDNTTATGTAVVANRSLSAQTNVGATLGYAATYSVINQAAGTFTQLPAVGDIVKPGQPLYSVDGKPVVMLTGSTAAYRTMVAGISGPDAQQLNTDLVSLGYGTAATLDTNEGSFGAATAAAVRKLQAHLGVTQTGVLTPDQVVFLPSAARITTVSVTVGAAAQTGAVVATATSTTRQVVVALDATQQATVKVGDHVVITLPDNSTTPGAVTTVGTVATVPQGGSGTPTIEVDITPTDPAATGSLDQAPVQVAITTANVDNALVVPVAALLAVAGGGYAIEVIQPDGTHQLIATTLGLFDDADGLVQVTGPQVRAGQRVVVPAS